MANEAHPSKGSWIWSVLWYGLALGLLLASIQLAQYRLLLLDHAQNLYIALIALLFTAMGIWAGRWFTRQKKMPDPQPAATNLLSGDELEKTLEQLGITPREYEVLHLIAQGLSNQEIAGRLFVSLNTVKTHTSNLFSKLDAQRRTQAVQKAQALGLLAPVHPKV